MCLPHLPFCWLHNLWYTYLLHSKRSLGHAISVTSKNTLHRTGFSPFSHKNESSYLLHPPWTQAPIHCSLHPHFLATSAGQLWSAASAVPVCLSCLFPMWVDRGNSPDRSLCSHLPHVSPEATPVLNSADRLPNVVLFCHCMAPVWKQQKVWHVRRGRATLRSLDSHLLIFKSPTWVNWWYTLHTCAFTSAPKDSRYSTIARYPWRDAKWRHVCPGRHKQRENLSKSNSMPHHYLKVKMIGQDGI